MMESGSADTILGWEKTIARESHHRRLISWIRPDAGEIRAMLFTFAVFLAVFMVSVGLTLDRTRAVTWSAFLPGTGYWVVDWRVVVMAIVFEFLDASAGMGYGTAITPLLLLIGYSPTEIIPAVMIQQATAGLTGAYLHREFGNVEWHIRPLSETMRLWMYISITGVLAVILSITSVYAIFKLAGTWIKAYVAVLLVVMGLVSLFNAGRDRPYRPRRMLFFGALAGFNKGIGGGGYGPVVTIGGILAGVPVKTMMAVTALSEGTVCLISIPVWYFVQRAGVAVSFGMLPSMMIGSMIAAIVAPWAVKIVHARFWKWFVPAYSLILAAYTTAKLLGM